MLCEIGGRAGRVELALDQVAEPRPGQLLDADRGVLESEEGHRSEALAVFAGDVEDRGAREQSQQDRMQAAGDQEVELAVSGDQTVDGTVELGEPNVVGGDLPLDLPLELNVLG